MSCRCCINYSGECASMATVSRSGVHLWVDFCLGRLPRSVWHGVRSVEAKGMRTFRSERWATPGLVRTGNPDVNVGANMNSRSVWGRCLWQGTASCVETQPMTPVVERSQVGMVLELLGEAESGEAVGGDVVLGIF